MHKVLSLYKFATGSLYSVLQQEYVYGFIIIIEKLKGYIDEIYFSLHYLAWCCIVSLVLSFLWLPFLSVFDERKVKIQHPTLQLQIDNFLVHITVDSGYVENFQKSQF